MFRLRPLPLLTLAAAVMVAVTVPMAASDASPQSLPDTLAALPSVTPALTQLGKIVASVSSATAVSFSVLVKGPDDAALPALARAVSDPSSPDFRHFLTRAQMLAQIDPSSTTTADVVNGLRALGIAVMRVSSDGRMVDAQAPAGILASALDLRLGNVTDPSSGLERVALNQPTLPAALRPLIADIVGLTSTPVSSFTTIGPVTVTNAPVAASFNGRPCSATFASSIATAQPTYQGVAQPYAICGYSPEQIRAAYRVPETGLTGKGVRIGIVDDYSSPTMVADANTYSAAHGLPPLMPGQYVDHSDVIAKSVPEVVVTTPKSVLGSVPAESPQQWSSEQSLDVEMVHTMAPGATIEFYGGDEGVDIQPLEAEFALAIADDQAQFITDSWGIGEKELLVTPADFIFMDLELQLGALEGVGASFSTGDTGDNIEANDVKEADFPASDAFGTAVGGTTLVMGPSDTYIGETYWGARLEPETKNGQGWDPTPVSEGIGPATGPGSFGGGGGGGVSDHYAEPFYQRGVVPDSLTTQRYTSPDRQNSNNVTAPGRVLPDVSLEGDSNTGVLIGQTQTDIDGKARYSEFRVGGTSVSSPLFGGLMALAIQFNGGGSLGFVSPALYAASIKSPDAFRDPLDHQPINVRSDYSNTQNPASPVVFHLRLLGQLGTLHALAGYDDSTGLGSPCASAFIPAIVAPNIARGAGQGCGAPIS